MSKSKIVAMMPLVVFAMGILLVGNSVAGEKFKCRTAWFTTKWDPINVGDEKDHVVAVAEGKGIISNMEGKTFGEGWLTGVRIFSILAPKPGRLAAGI